MTAIDEMDNEQLTEHVVLFLRLHKYGWPLTEENTDDCDYACRVLLAHALVRGGLSVDAALHQVGERDGELRVTLEADGELSIIIEYEEHDENAVGITIVEGE